MLQEKENDCIETLEHKEQSKRKYLCCKRKKMIVQHREKQWLLKAKGLVYGGVAKSVVVHAKKNGL